MNRKLCFICGHDIDAALAQAIAMEGWNDVTVIAACEPGGGQALCWEELQRRMTLDCAQVVALDSGVFAEMSGILPESVRVIPLPAKRMAAGSDYLRLKTARIVSEWRLDEERKQTNERGQAHARERADQLAATDFLARLAQLTDEQQTVAAIEELFKMLFAPQELYYVRIENGSPQTQTVLPLPLRRQLEAMATDWAWTPSGKGFLLRIVRGGNALGAIAADHFAFPQFRERYLNLALSMVSVCGLSIENARTYERVKAAEEALRRRERSLLLAQSIAHLGHWEWVVDTDDITWSEETYRILGYSPQAIQPSRDAFLRAVHPEDRAQVEQNIRLLQQGERFDLEYRLMPAGGGLRVVRGLGEVVHFSASEQPRIIGTLQEVTPQRQLEILGVIQDITERKELEWRLEQEARTDPLTGCANRRYFLQQAELAFARARRYNEELSIFMLDLDHFKSVNDNYGHTVGDAILKKVVQICHHTLRHEDLVGRLGGEEFAVLLPETGNEKATEAAERLREAIAANALVLANEEIVRITTSIGIATQEPGDETMETTLAHADRALYQAKNRGRNQVISYFKNHFHL